MVGVSGGGSSKLANTGSGTSESDEDRRLLINDSHDGTKKKEEEEDVVSTSIYQLPAGYKFAPTDQEIVGYFLLRRVSGGGEITPNPITECDGDRFYSTHPKDLVPKSREVSWYFYIRQEGDVHLQTTREVRDGVGTWRIVEPESQIRVEPNVSKSSVVVVGVKMVFAFFQLQRQEQDSNNRRLKKTHWTMTEYRLLHHDDEQDCYQESARRRMVLTRVNRGKQLDGCGGGGAR